MNILPEHNLEYTNVMNELLQHKIHCKYNVTIVMLNIYVLFKQKWCQNFMS